MQNVSSESSLSSENQPPVRRYGLAQGLRRLGGRFQGCKVRGAVFAAERRLRRDGVRAFQASAPRTNGHGMYFWLRVGYVPLRGDDRDDGATWFELPRRRRRRRPRRS